MHGPEDGMRKKLHTILSRGDYKIESRHILDNNKSHTETVKLTVFLSSKNKSIFKKIEV